MASGTSIEAAGPAQPGASARPSTPLTLSARQRRRRRRHRVLSVVRAFGELLITAGALVLLFVAYLLWWTDVVEAHTQTQLAQRLEQEWTEAPAQQSPVATMRDTPLGDGLAVIYVPRFGSSYHQVVVQGTDQPQLAKGPGHYLGTPLPGSLGNVAIAGHRTTHGHPFRHLDEIKPGDEIVIETATSWFTYQARTEIAVDPTQGFPVVTNDPPPVPAHGIWPAWSLQPGDHALTLTTCTPVGTAAQRLILHGELVRTEPRVGNQTPKALLPHQGLAGSEY